LYTLHPDPALRNTTGTAGLEAQESETRCGLRHSRASKLGMNCPKTVSPSCPFHSGASKRGFRFLCNCGDGSGLLEAESDQGPAVFISLGPVSLEFHPELKACTGCPKAPARAKGRDHVSPAAGTWDLVCLSKLMGEEVGCWSEPILGGGGTCSQPAFSHSASE
jgi:hypothetical protein